MMTQPNNSTTTTTFDVAGDDESDYGSDFTPEDIQLLDRYLIQANSESFPPLAIADPDDEPGHGHFAYVPRRRTTISQDADNEKEVFSQYTQSSSDPSFSKLVGATLASPPSFGPEVPPGGSFRGSEFDDEALESWNVWKDALPRSDDITPAQANTIETGAIGQSMGDVFKQPDIEGGRDEGLSPLERFRSPPKKPLSVTDLVSPAWCELQYYFTLTRYGKIRPTAAMQRGSVVHAKLEEEVFTRVQVPIQSKEDRWALQIWNLIISLRTLRETGMTREMQVWGVLEGQVIAGVIDELRIGSAATEHELHSEAESDRQITNEALIVSKTRALPGSLQRQPDQHLVFLTDMKTRSSKSIPRGSSLRGTIYQLMLYHTLLYDFVSHRTDFQVIFDRYRLDPNKPFTETFLEQMYELEIPGRQASSPEASQGQFSVESAQTGTHSTIDTPSSSFLRGMSRLADGTPAPSISAPSESNVHFGSQLSSISSLSPEQSHAQLPSTIRNNHPHLETPPQQVPYTPIPLSPSSLFHRHNTLSSLLTLLSREITLTFPNGSASLSPYLHACYRDKNTSEITGRRVFMHDPELLSQYLKSEISWWTGQRETKGVTAEEAFKCGMCEFAKDCDWYAGLAQEAEIRQRERTFKRDGWTDKSTTTAATTKNPTTKTKTKAFSTLAVAPPPTRSTITTTRMNGPRVRIALDPEQEQEQEQEEQEDRVPARDQESKSESSDKRTPTRVPGAWISETGSEALLVRADGVEVGGGRRGQERSRSVV